MEFRNSCNTIPFDLAIESCQCACSFGGQRSGAQVDRQRFLVLMGDHQSERVIAQAFCDTVATIKCRCRDDTELPCRQRFQLSRESINGTAMTDQFISIKVLNLESNPKLPA